MPAPITPELFQRLVELAALELDPEESEYLRSQLNQQLKSIAELENIPMDEEINPTVHGVSYPPALIPIARQDHCITFTDTRSIINQAPQVIDGFVVAPEATSNDMV